MIYFVTNRIPPPNSESKTEFGSVFNVPEGSSSERSEIRIGWIDPKTGRTRILPESDNPRSLELNPPSRRLFNFYRAQQTGESRPRNVLFHIHGYNTDFRKSVEEAKDLEQTYGVDVILFSWPSRGDGPGEDPYWFEEIYGIAGYKADKQRAKRSGDELLRTLKKLSEYFAEIRNGRCNQKFSLLAFSMGNYVLKKAEIDGEASAFDNIILTAPDVNRDDHGEWISKLKQRGHVYVCMNQRDFPLNVSEAKFGYEQRKRLGCHLPREVVDDVYYLDWTDYAGIRRKHGFVFKKSWNTEDGGNTMPDALRATYHSILNGGDPLGSIPGYSPEKQIYLMKKELNDG